MALGPMRLACNGHHVTVPWALAALTTGRFLGDMSSSVPGYNMFLFSQIVDPGVWKLLLGSQGVLMSGLLYFWLAVRSVQYPAVLH